MKKKLLLLSIQIVVAITLSAQNTVIQPATTSQPKDNAWELGLHAGHLFSNGNIKFIPGYGGGIHIRRALDHVFSLRLDLMYGAAKGEDDGNVRSFETQWAGGSLQLVTSLNNLKWNLGERKTNIYALGGLGMNSFSGDKLGEGGEVNIASDLAAHADLGAGIAFRITNRVNFGIEHKVAFVLGKRADLIDGVQTFVSEERSTFRDPLNYTSVRLNINLGNLSTKTEPLYWVNPLDGVINDLARLKDTRVSLTDTDGDGVIDMMDEEESTPEGATVNSKGVTLDSDSDGYADHLDKEPFSPPGYSINAQGVAQVPDPAAEMRRYIDEKLRNFTPAATTPAAVNTNGIYLPNIYFPLGGADLSPMQIGTLASVAHIMKANPSLRFTVIGHTDEQGVDAFNQTLSFKRAETVINTLVGKFGISRNSLVLQYKGETDLLLKGASDVNRRVEFRVAGNETDMAAPSNK